jgi:hypothetical protein
LFTWNVSTQNVSGPWQTSIKFQGLERILVCGRPCTQALVSTHPISVSAMYKSSHDKDPRVDQKTEVYVIAISQDIQNQTGTN